MTTAQVMTSTARPDHWAETEFGYLSHLIETGRIHRETVSNPYLDTTPIPVELRPTPQPSTPLTHRSMDALYCLMGRCEVTRMACGGAASSEYYCPTCGYNLISDYGDGELDVRHHDGDCPDVCADVKAWL